MSALRLRDDLALAEGYHSAHVDVAVRLNTNESPYPPPPAWRDALLDEIAKVPFHRYPDRRAWRLRTAIGELHGVGPEQVLATKGSNEALQALCLAYGGAGRVAAVFEPTYALHRHIARLTGTTVVTGRRDRAFRIDPDEVRRILSESSPSVTFLCSPNNPTGASEAPEVIAGVVDQAPGLVVVDEAYAEFAPWSALALVAQGRPVAVTRTYSKTWSMAAARLGYLVASPEIVEDVESVLLPYHLDAMSQAAGLVALRYQEEMRARVDLLVSGREHLARGLRELSLTTWPSDANFVLFRPAAEGHGEAAAVAKAVWQGLVDRSVLVRDCSSWPGLDGCLRVTVGTPQENDAFLVALSEALG